jgi:hypothetical protein
MTDAEYVLWAAANRSITSVGLRAKTPCFDCPLAFAAAMLREGCCNGVPGPQVGGRPRQADTHQRALWRASQQRRRDRARA